MKYSEFKRYLKKQGATFDTQGKGSHMTVYLNGKRTTFPYHASKEISEPLRKAIMKQLGIK